MSNDTIRITRTIAEIRAEVHSLRMAGKRIAFVPTMGALHQGHLALVDVAHRHADVVVVSIFVNPLQFGLGEDLAKYPRMVDADINVLGTGSAVVVFVPTTDEMYPAGLITRVSAAPLDALFEGAIRPGHFTGVLTVVNKLFNIVHPDVALFGQKDLQQLSLIQRMVRDLDIPIEVVSVPTVREEDGLAMSSRNRYLSSEDRIRATRLHLALLTIRDLFEKGEHDAAHLLDRGGAVLAQDPHIHLDYLALVNPVDFSTVDTVIPGTSVIVAARLSGTRLLDNIIL
jgi:pantoate--beta-alanine ligase